MPSALPTCADSVNHRREWPWVSESASELLELIRDDYVAHPVSRQIAGADDRPETPGCRFLPEG
jgi:hypothetical protein